MDKVLNTISYKSNRVLTIKPGQILGMFLLHKISSNFFDRLNSLTNFCSKYLSVPLNLKGIRPSAKQSFPIKSEYNSTSGNNSWTVIFLK